MPHVEERERYMQVVGDWLARTTEPLAIYPAAVGVPLLNRLPDPWRKVVDWLLTISLAIGFVLVFEAKVAKPFRIPSSSMEPTLHCARPGSGCLSATSDRVLVNRLAYDFGSPQRGQIVVFTAPAGANVCEPGDAGTTFVKRLIGLPGETVREDERGFIWIREPGASSWTKLKEPYVSARTRLADSAEFGQTWPVPTASTSCSATTAPTPATRAGGARFRAAA